MIEVVYNEDKKKPVGNEEFFDIPKNIRQIGQVEDSFKIYIEDYAYHYLDRMADEVSGGRIALLLGQSNWKMGITYIFIKSAFQLDDMEADDNHISFNEEIWSGAAVIMENYFRDQEIVGWYFTIPECSMEITEAMYRAHLNYFAGNDKVFFMREPLDGEEAFYRYDNGTLRKQKGYYLYYQRNDAMQEFMIDRNQNMPMESGEMVRDKAVKDFRELIVDKNNEKKEANKGGSYFMYASTVAAIILALALGTNYLNNYQKLKNVPQAVEEVTSQLGATATPLPEATVILKVTQTPKATKTETPEETVTPEAARIQASEETVTPEVTRTQAPEENSAPATIQNIAQDTRTYEIREGDTLTSISNAIYGNTQMIDAICTANNITEDTVIYPGETILLP